MKKQVAIVVIIEVFIPLLFLFYLPPTASSQLGFSIFILALGAIIIELWMLAGRIAVSLALTPRAINIFLAGFLVSLGATIDVTVGGIFFVISVT